MIAKEKNTTVSAILKDLLTDYVGTKSELDEIKKRLEALEKEVFKKR